MTDEPTLPTVNSLADWSVGLAADGTPEVRMKLTDPDEARAWLVWLLDKGNAP